MCMASTAMSRFGFSGFAIDDLHPSLHQLLPFRIRQPAHAWPILLDHSHSGRLFFRKAGRHGSAFVRFHRGKLALGTGTVNAASGGGQNVNGSPPDRSKLGAANREGSASAPVELSGNLAPRADHGHIQIEAVLFMRAAKLFIFLLNRLAHE